jgi:hypothetical protein
MRLTRALPVAVVAAVLILSACSDSGDMDSGGADGGQVAEAPAEDLDALDSADGVAVRRDAESGGDAPQAPIEKAIIAKGNVQLTSDDVEQTVFDVQALVDEYDGEITDRETGTDEDGEVRNARLVLRIPSKDFESAFTDLEQVADLRKSGATEEDVTTQVIDNAVRIRAQRRSLRRVEVLLDRAQSIRDIVAIEAQLTRRQAHLDSLEQTQAYLEDQTSMSTITVNIQRTPEQEEEKEKDDDAGFVSGLEGGWDALVTFGTGVATLAGALLPWAVALVIVGGPVLLLARRFRRRTPTAPGTAEPSDA